MPGDIEKARSIDREGKELKVKGKLENAKEKVKRTPRVAHKLKGKSVSD